MVDTVETLSLFSGVGMLDEAVGFALKRRGINHHVAAYCEWESAAASTLIARMEEQSLEPCPVFCGDLRDFPAESFAGRIDGITAGYPCQPYSLAGSRRGLKDARALGECGTGPIHQMLRIINVVEPTFVFLENVSAAFKHFRPIGQRLEKIGYAIAPPLFLAAEDVGASHRRERIFVLAYRDGDRFNRIREFGECQTGDDVDDGNEELADSSKLGSERSEGGRRQAVDRAADESEELADTDEHGSGGQRPAIGSETEGAEAFGASGHMADTERGNARQPVPGKPGQAGTAVTTAGEELANASCTGRKERAEQRGDTGKELEALERSCPIGIFAPGPGDYAGWGSALADAPHLAPAIKPEVRVLVDGVAMDLDASRADQLRQTGNGVVATQAAVAFEHLVKRVE